MPSVALKYAPHRIYFVVELSVDSELSRGRRQLLPVAINKGYHNLAPSLGARAIQSSTRVGSVKVSYRGNTAEDRNVHLPSLTIPVASLVFLHWFSRNRKHFPGGIPAELSKLPALRILHLEDNIYLEGERFAVFTSVNRGFDFIVT